MIGRNQAKIILTAEDKTTAAFASVSRSFDGLGKSAASLSRLLPGLAAGLSAGSLVNYTRELARTGQEIDRLARLSGVTVERFQAEAFAAERAGISQEKYADILKDVQDKVGDFLQNGGGPLKDFFDNIAPQVGVTAEEFRKLSGSDALQLYVKSLQQANLSQSEMTFYMEAIASDSALLTPLLRDNAAEMKRVGEQAQALGIVMDRNAIEQTRRFNETLRELEATAEGFGRQVALPIIEGLNTVIGQFQESERAGKSFFASYLAGVRGFYEAIGVIEAQKKPLAPAFGADDQSRAEARRLGLVAPTPIPAAPTTTTRKARTGGATKDPYAEATRYLEALQKQLQALDNLSVSETLLADIRAGRLGKLTPELQAQLEATAQQIDLDRELNAATEEAVRLREELAEAAARALDEQQQLVQAMLDATPTAQLEKQRDAMLLLAKAFEDGKISAEQFGEAAQTYLGNLPKEVESATSFAKDMGLTFTSAFEDAIAGGKSLSDVIKGLEQDLLRLITRKLVTEPLGNFLTTAIQGFKWADGGIMSSAGPLPLKTYARGGVANSPQVAIFGEGSMNEAYVPLPDGRRIPVALQGGGGGGGSTIQVTNHFSVPATVDRRTQEQIASMAGAAVNRATRRLS